MAHFRLLIPFIFIVAAAAMSSCAPARKQQVLDVAGFEPYVATFEQKSAEYGDPVKVSNLVIRFGGMSNELEHGVCEIAGEEPPTITIDPEYWNQVDERTRETLVVHEMGHCVLRRAHKNRVDSHGNPESLMSPFVIDGRTFVRYETNYWQELFGSKNPADYF